MVNLETYYSPEVEEALVTLVWHKPELLGQVLRSVDPAKHILQEHLRFILEAIQLAQDLLGTSDFASVVQVLREDNRFEACGELVGLDAIYARNWGYESLLDYYIELLKLYATKRGQQDPKSVTIFSGGKGTIHFVKEKPTNKHADYTGAALIRGRRYQIAAWVERADPASLSLKFYAA